MSFPPYYAEINNLFFFHYFGTNLKRETSKLNGKQKIKSYSVLIKFNTIDGIIFGTYELLEKNTVIDVFFIPSFIIAFSLTINIWKKNKMK